MARDASQGVRVAVVDLAMDERRPEACGIGLLPGRNEAAAFSRS
jgi:hypothetical protein